MAASAQKLREINFLKDEPKKNKEFADNTVTTSKYTLITFLPRNLFFQFRRMVNFFFLCLIIIQVSIDIPVEPIPYIAAFVFVIGITATKQGYEDWMRHRADASINFAVVHIVDENGNVIKLNAKDIRVGQLVKLEGDEAVPCDLLLIACESTSGQSQSFCQIRSDNLDGESNLKMRFCSPGLDLILEDNRVISDKLKKYFFQYEQPNSDLYSFNGQITSPTFDKPVQITMENVLLRGTRVKNCRSVYAVAIYTGRDTRLSMNSSKVKTSKFSTIEHSMNKIVIGMFIGLLTLSSISLGLSFVYKDNKFGGMWYLPKNDDSDSKHGITIFFAYCVLLCYMIPVSLSVSFEVQKLGCSKFFGWDQEMICPDTGAQPICNTSDLNEELGQIEYLFSDKTGTLTDNDLVFRCCSINGVKYEYSESSKLKQINENETLDQEHEKLYNAFLETLAVCHTLRVLPRDSDNFGNDDNGQLVYQTSSLDEEILVKMAHSLNVQFLGGQDKNFTLKKFGNVKEMKTLAILEFDSDRKCMSTIIQDELGTCYMFSKGAESSILPKCTKSSQTLIDLTANHVTDFAKMGYRTLVVAFKKLERPEVDTFLQKYEEYRSSPEYLNKLYVQMEQDLHLLGCTGVEDKLQPGVPETLYSLKEAGIKILMLTGDKLETAISVGSTCGIISSSHESKENADKIFIVEQMHENAILEKRLHEFTQLSAESSSVLVMDGQSFALALECCKDLVRRIIIEAKSVIFCRMAPLQKSQVVHLVKNNPKKQYKTCAVGDGGNDCAMLREAHLGIGIIGKEGLQAARESDFAVPRFRFLQKAILVHGSWYYHRLSALITYFFYRGVVFIFQIFLYGFDTGFSAQTIFDSTFVMMFTIAFTSIPVVVQGLVDQQYSKEELLNSPRLYREITRNAHMSLKNVSRWYLIGIWHILICYYVPRYVWIDGSSLNDYGSFSLFISSIIVIITDTKVLVEGRYFTWPTLCAQVFSYTTLIGFYMLLCHAMSNGKGLLAFSFIPLLQQVNFWFTAMLILVLSIVPDLTYFTGRLMFFGY
ncbi:probable phospholipid-transporting ATPase IF [Folsomia candida]|uniref:Phospholipid-transporting ATPase n=1 Tax=Folsomia candida TaxID=158441 RepID=A0A226E3C4_FOLCA|nr:probable phospholipid-transporting ATPase IF [Folsomia candida]OXA51467.1 putative phospholipid-transporting ATPase IF [Folsomia candida]